MPLDYTFHYKVMVGGRLTKLFSEDKLYTEEVIIEMRNEAFKAWLIEFSLGNGYIPVLSSSDVGGYVVVSFIKRFIPC
jgi:hypothetical protein